MATRVLINERDGSTTPMNDRVVLDEPRHTKDDIIPAECSSGEIELILVISEANGYGREDTTGRLSATISKGYGTRRATCDEGQRVLENERRRDEVTRGAAVDEDHDGNTGNLPGQLNEAEAGSGELVDLAWYRWCTWCRAGQRRRRGRAVATLGLRRRLEGDTSLGLRRCPRGVAPLGLRRRLGWKF